MPGKTKRNDKSKRISGYLQEQEGEPNAQGGSLGKSVLILVEGATEQDYFEYLKQNAWFRNNMAGVVVEIGENLGKMKARAKEEIEKQNYQQIWIVVDHDKRNALILEKRGRPFFESADLPEKLKDSLRQAYVSDEHAYFWSTYDYLQWLSRVIGAEAAIEFWDKLHFLTPNKPREFADFVEDKFLQQNENKIRLAYSCIAFEYWLILHFQQVCQPFLWVDKGKNTDIDVVEYLRTIPNFRDYEKGKNVYLRLFDISRQTPNTPSKEDDWKVLHKIIVACKNAKWLRTQMQPTLDRQAGKWYEVNPYILGIDDLMFTLLNIHHQGNPIDFFGLTVSFKFSLEQKILRLLLSVDNGEAFGIDESHSGCFEIKSADQAFLPSNVPPVEFPNGLEWIDIPFDQLPDQIADLVLIFRDPRERSKSYPLLIFLG